MSNILLTRVDNRLIHGQVAIGWTNYARANTILVINDEIANDPIQQSLMDMAVSDGIETRYFTIEEAIKKIPYAADSQKLFLVVRNLQDVLKLIEGGVEIKKINIGNLHYAEGKRQIAKSVAINDHDEKTIKEINKHGIKLIVRRVPEERGEDILDFIQKSKGSE